MTTTQQSTQQTRIIRRELTDWLRAAEECAAEQRESGDTLAAAFARQQALAFRSALSVVDQVEGGVIA